MSIEHITLAIEDGLNKENYDREFYKAMYQISPLAPEEIDARVRRALLRFIADGKGEESKPDNGGYVIMGFTHGYMVGRKLKKDIRRKR